MITEHHTLSRRSALALATVWAGGLTRAWGAPPVVCVVLSDNGPVFLQAANELQAALQAQNPGLAVQRAYPSELDAIATPTLVLPLGSAAYRAVTEKTRRSAAWAEVPVIGSLLPRSSHAAVHQALGPRGLNTAVLLDQPVARSLRLAQLALPGLSRVGVLYGPQSVSLRPATAAAARALGLGLVESQVAAQASADDLFAPLSDALEGAELLLALPDSVVYNATSLQNILIASYRRRVPLLGYTVAQVRAGATLGLYTSSAQSAQQVAELAAPWLSDRAEATRPRSGGWSATTDPALFDVGINSQVARSLGLGLATPAALAEALQRSEGRR